MRALIPISIFMLILSAFFVSAASLGLTPPEGFIDFEPGKSVELSYNVLSSADDYIKIFTQGDLRDNIRFKGIDNLDIVHFSNERNIVFEVYLDPDLTPGRHSTYIYNEQTLPPELKQYSGGMSAVAAVVYTFHVDVPYPGKYITAEFEEIGNIRLGETAYFTVLLNNLGSEPVSDIKGFVKIYSNDTLLKEIPTTKLEFLNPKSTGKIHAYTDTKSFKPGIYTAKTSLDYGEDRIASATRRFNLGDIAIDIKGLYSYLNVTDIGQFSIIVKSLWNDLIKGVFTDIELIDKDSGVIVKATKTPMYDLPPWSEISMDAFINVRDIEAGNYTARVIAHYEGKTEQKSFDIEITKPEQRSPFWGISSSMMVIIIGSIVLFLAVSANILILFYFKRK